MPRYRCLLSSPADNERRAATVAELVRIEASRFGTDADDLLVEFTEVEQGLWFTAAQVSQATLVTGTVPAGTSQAERAELMDEIGRSVAAALGQEFNDVMVVASDGRRGR